VSEIYELNKYGAIDPKYIKNIEDNIDRVKTEVNIIFTELGYYRTLHRFLNEISYQRVDQTDLLTRLKKLEELTNANDYEYKTTPPITKLVKKSKIKK